MPAWPVIAQGTVPHSIKRDKELCVLNLEKTLVPLVAHLSITAQCCYPPSAGGKTVG